MSIWKIFVFRQLRQYGAKVIPNKTSACKNLRSVLNGFATDWRKDVQMTTALDANIARKPGKKCFCVWGVKQCIIAVDPIRKKHGGKTIQFCA